RRVTIVNADKMENDRLSRFLTTVAILLAVSGGGPAHAEAQTSRQIAERTLPSVVLLTVGDSSGRAIAQGSGFFVRQDLIATNCHVVAGASRVRAKLVRRAVGYEIAGVVALDETADLCVLKAGDPKAIGAGVTLL